jgi:RNA polymerase sigma factor (sigma-70 family)
MPATHQLTLSQRLLADDEHVLGEVLRTFGPSVHAILVRKYQGVLTSHDIDDVLSIGLFRLWQSRSRFDQGKGSLRVWFFRIVDNAARDVLRLGWQRARQLEVSTEPVALASVVDHRDNGRETKNASGPPSEQQMDIREIVASLPETQRRIVLADALARDDIACSQRLAEDLGIPAATVRVYRKRALDKVRAELKRRSHDLS